MALEFARAGLAMGISQSHGCALSLALHTSTNGCTLRAELGDLQEFAIVQRGLVRYDSGNGHIEGCVDIHKGGSVLQDCGYELFAEVPVRTAMSPCFHTGGQGWKDPSCHQSQGPGPWFPGSGSANQGTAHHRV